MKAVIDVLEKYGEDVLKEMVSRLGGHGKSSSGRLIRSLKKSIRKDGEALAITFQMDSHGDYVDKGVEGAEGRLPGVSFKSPYKFKKMPPLSKIKQWCRLKGIDEQFAFPIAKKIYRFGIAPTNFFSISVKRREKDLHKLIAEAYKKEVQNQLKNERQ
jgi:hypothetical protein